jgi:hypothetical protein
MTLKRRIDAKEAHFKVKSWTGVESPEASWMNDERFKLCRLLHHTFLIVLPCPFILANLAAKRLPSHANQISSGGVYMVDLPK